MGNPSPVRFPDELLREDLTLLRAAELLAGAGVKVLPVSSAPDHNGISSVKKPGRLLGKGWQTKTTSDLDVVREWFDPARRTATAAFGDDLDPVRTCTRHVDYDTLGIGIHADALVIVDIDDPDAVPVQMWQYLDVVPFHKSADDDTKRGHYFFQRPQSDEFYFGQTSRIKPSPGGTSPGEIRHGTAFTVTAPTPHPRASGRYHWVRAGEVLVMPEEVAHWLKSEKRHVEWNGHKLEVAEASLEDYERFRETTTGNSRPEILDDLAHDLRTDAYVSALHNPTIRILIEALEYAMHGYIRGDETIDRLGDVFMAAATDPSRGGNVRGETEAQDEYFKCLSWAMGRVKAKFVADRAALNYSVHERVTLRWGGDEALALLDSLEMPEGYELPPQMPDRGRIWYHPKETVTDDGVQLVKADDKKLARAVLDRVSPRLLCIPRGDKSDWCLWSDPLGVWDILKGANHVRNMVSTILVEDIAPCTSVPLNKAIGRTDPIPPEIQNALDERYGPTSYYLKVNRSFGESFPNMSRITDTLATFPEIAVNREDFDRTDTDWVPVSNGMLNVRTRDFRPVSPNDLVTRRMPVAYDPSAQCPNYLKFLYSALRSDEPGLAEESASLIQRFFGAALLGDWKDDAFLYVYGAAGSGKSTLFSKVPGAIFGLGMSSSSGGAGLFGTVDSSLFTAKGSRDFQMAALSGLRLVTCDEAFSTRAHIDQGFFKGFTSGEPQQCAFKTRDHFSMIPPRVVFMSNNEPTFMFTGDGETRRARFIRFEHGHSTIDPTLPKPDTDLFERDLLPEISGILNWYLDGAAAYLAGEKLSIGASLYVANKGSLSDSSPLGQFFQMFTSGQGQPGIDDLTFEVDELHALYADWIIMTKGSGASVEIVDKRQFLAHLSSDFPLARVYRKVGGKDQRAQFRSPGDRPRRKAVGVSNIRGLEDEGVETYRRGELVFDGLPGADASSGITVLNDTIVIPAVERWRADNPGRAMGRARLYTRERSTV